MHAIFVLPNHLQIMRITLNVGFAHNEAHLIELVCTLSAQVVLAWQDDHGLVEDLHADGTHQLFLQRCQRCVSLCSLAALEAAQVC